MCVLLLLFVLFPYTLPLHAHSLSYPHSHTFTRIHLLSHSLAHTDAHTNALTHSYTLTLLNFLERRGRNPDSDSIAPKSSSPKRAEVVMSRNLTCVTNPSLYYERTGVMIPECDVQAVPSEKVPGTQINETKLM